MYRTLSKLLMYERNSRIVLDYLLGNCSKESTVITEEWATSQKKCLENAFKHATDDLHKNAERRHRHYNESAREAPIPVGNTVLLIAHPAGRNKTQYNIILVPLRAEKTFKRRVWARLYSFEY